MTQAPAMPTSMTVVVVDDEERSRRRLVRMLSSWPSLDVVAEASCGAEAVEIIDRLRPEIVFLDVQMPDLDGFGVLDTLKQRPRYVIFTTAYDRYALDAFAVGAVDYLLKPFGERELARAVSRAAERSAEDRFRQGYERLLQALERPSYMERVPVGYLKDIVLLPVAEITHFAADREMVAIHVGAEQYTTEMTLVELEQKLDPQRFFRAHRRAIINLEHLLRLEPVEGSRYLAVLSDGSKVEVSRNASRRLREKLGL
jgi:DNA-binding LytR/AlgR family response regulator